MTKIDVKKTRKHGKAPIGVVVKIPLENGKFGFAQSTHEGHFAFFDIVSDGTPVCEDIICRNVLFDITVYSDATSKKGGWEMLGVCPLSKGLLKPIQMWSFDEFAGIFKLYISPAENSLGYSWEPASYEEVKSVPEKFIVWEPLNAAKRLQDEMEGKSNKNAIFHSKESTLKRAGFTIVDGDVKVLDA